MSVDLSVPRPEDCLSSESPDHSVDNNGGMDVFCLNCDQRYGGHVGHDCRYIHEDGKTTYVMNGWLWDPLNPIIRPL